MKPRELITLIVILIVLVALVAVKKTQHPKELTTEEYVPLNISFDPAQILAIEIIKPKPEQKEEYVELVKSGEDWKLKSLNNARADKQKVDDFLKELKEAKGELRSHSKDLFGDFGIGDDQAYHIRLKDSINKAVVDLQVGNKKSQTSIFVRRSGSNDVFFTGADLFGKIGIFEDPQTAVLDNNYWADTVLVKLDPEKVIDIEAKRFKDGGEIVSAHVTRKNPDGKISDWRFANDKIPFAADPEKVKSFIKSFETWRASRVLETNAKEFGFDQAPWQIIFELEGKGDLILIKSGKTDEASKSTYMFVSSEPVSFLLSPYYVENMDADDTRFIVDNPLRAVADKTETLIVQADKQRYEVHPKEKTWEGLTQYLDQLKNFRPARVIFDPNEKKKLSSRSKHSIEVHNPEDKSPMIVDFGDLIKDAPKEYAVQVRGSDFPFAVANYNFDDLFGKLERLEAPAEAPKAEPKSETKTDTPSAEFTPVKK